MKSSGSHRSCTKRISRCSPSGTEYSTRTAPDAVEVAEQRRGDAGLLPRLLAHRLVDAHARGDAPAHQVVELARIDRLVRAARARSRRMREAAAAREAVQVGGVGDEAEVARGGALDAKQLRARRNASATLTSSSRQPRMTPSRRELARHLRQRGGAPGGGVGLARRRHVGGAHLEDVRPAAQQVGERGPQPAHDGAPSRRTAGRAARGRRARRGCRRAEETEQVA